MTTNLLTVLQAVWRVWPWVAILLVVCISKGYYSTHNELQEAYKQNNEQRVEITELKASIEIQNKAVDDLREQTLRAEAVALEAKNASAKRNRPLSTVKEKIKESVGSNCDDATSLAWIAIDILKKDAALED